MITGDSLRQARTLRGATQQQIAEHVGVALRTIGNWERAGAQQIPAKHWRAVEEILPAATVAASAPSLTKSPELLEQQRQDRHQRTRRRQVRDWLVTGRRPDTQPIPDEWDDDSAAPLDRLYVLRDQLDNIIRDLELDPDARNAYPSVRREDRERELRRQLRAELGAEAASVTPIRRPVGDSLDYVDDELTGLADAADDAGGRSHEDEDEGREQEP